MQIKIYPERNVRPLGDLFGIFFEDLNHAADGGLYAEMVRNRSFDFQSTDRQEYTPLTAWEAINGGSIGLCSEAPVFANKPRYIKLSGAAGAGVRNLGYGEGMYFAAGNKYDLTFYAACEGDTQLTCALEGAQARADVAISGGWKKYAVTLEAQSTCNSGRLTLSLSGGGAILLDQISLFPQDTFMGKPGGLRRDIAEALRDMQPRFMRFPGGCLAHDGELDPALHTAMYRWKNTVGDVDSRPTRRNNWGYNQTLGLGFYEFFEFCEQIGAQPLPVVSGGCDPHHRRFAEGERLQEFIQDALDLIEFARGDASTEWGGLRASMGHPAPFGLKYIAVGNEEVHAEFYERLPLFVKAIRARYPDIQIIGSAGPFAAGSEFERGWNSARENAVDLVDEHYYEPPVWYMANMDRYLNYPADGPKVFLGEYASWGNRYENALTEAAYMVQMQNAPAVGLACYAPMLCRAEYVNWKPDMLWFNNRELMRTPNYYVQSMFMRNQGDSQLYAEITGESEPVEIPAAPLAGKMQLFAERSRFAIRNLCITGADGGAFRHDDFVIEPDATIALGETNGDFVLECEAERLDGPVGLKFEFGIASDDPDSKLRWCFGGWENQDSLLEKCTDGGTGCLTQTEFSVKTGHSYKLRMEVSGRRIRTHIDGELINDATDTLPRIKELYTAFSRDDATGDMIIKAVNMNARAVRAGFETAGAGSQRISCESMAGFGLGDTNVLGQCEAVRPERSAFEADGAKFDYEFPALSVTVLRVSAADMG